MLFLSIPSRKSIVSNISCQGGGLAKLMLTKDGSGSSMVMDLESAIQELP